MPNLYRAIENNSELEKEEKKVSKKKKIDFNLYKKNTIKSLNDVEYFLNNFKQFSKYIKLYKIFRK